MVAPYLVVLPEDAGQRVHSLREVFNGLRYIVKTGAPWRWMPNDLPPWEIVYQQALAARRLLRGPRRGSPSATPNRSTSSDTV